jgi:hypothetical protein
MCRNSWLRAQITCGSPLALRATSHTRLKARDHCNLRAFIGWKGGDCPSSLHTRRWRPKGPKWTSWMKSLRDSNMADYGWGFMASRNLCQPHLLEVGLTKIPGDNDFFLIFFFQQDRFQDRLQGKFQDRQKTPPSNSLKLMEFETYYIKPNRPFFSCQ